MDHSIQYRWCQEYPNRCIHRCREGLHVLRHHPPTDEVWVCDKHEEDINLNPPRVRCLICDEAQAGKEKWI